MKRRLAMSLAILAMVTATCMWLQNGNRPVRLKDGSLLSVASVRYGRTNEFVIGNFVERTFGRFLPRAGITLFGFKLAPPERRVYSWAEGPHLAIMFRLENANDPKNPLLQPNLYQHSRLLFISDDGFAYYGGLGAFSKFGKADYYGFELDTVFPQQSEGMRIRIELMEGGDWAKQIPGTWRSLAEFRVRNPRNTRAESWIADPAQVSKRIGDLEVTLGGVLVGRTPTNFAITRPELCATVPFQTRVGGQTSTNWRAHDIVLSDSDGNSIAPCSPLSITNGWRNYASWGVLDPRRVWKVHAEFARDSGFLGDELCTLQVQYPLANPLHTNFHGVPVRAEFDPIDIDKLAICLTNRQESTRLTLVHAHNEDGNALHGWSDSQHQIRIAISVPKAGTIVTTTFAIHKNIPLECFTQPKLTEPLGTIRRVSVNKNDRSP